MQSFWPAKMASSFLVLSLVERGWQAVRVWSLDSAVSSLRWVHLVKGRLGEARALIVLPPGSRLVDVRPKWFTIAVVWWLCRTRFSGGLRLLMVDNERSLRRWQPWARALDVAAAQIAWDGQRARVSGAAGAELTHTPGKAPLA